MLLIFGTRTLHARNQHIYYVVVFMYGACTLPSYQSFAVKWKSNQILSFDIFLNEFSATVQVLVTLGFKLSIQKYYFNNRYCVGAAYSAYATVYDYNVYSMYCTYNALQCVCYVIICNMYVCTYNALRCVCYMIIIYMYVHIMLYNAYAI